MNKSGPVIAITKRLAGLAGQSERTFMLGLILFGSAVSAATGFILARCYSVDVLTSLLMSAPEDCWGDWRGLSIGRHCFGDYAMTVNAGMRPNPWAPLPVYPPRSSLGLPYPAAGWVPHLLFAVPAKWIGAPLLGLFGYLAALTVSILSPAAWAARGARGLESMVLFFALSAAAIPAWQVIDRGNSTGFMVPMALVFLVALRRERWVLVAFLVVLAALLKPMFALLAVALFAARQWRLGGFALGAGVVLNLAAYLIWPRYFPDTLRQSFHNLSGTPSFDALIWPGNISFSRAVMLVPDNIKLFQTGGIPDGFLARPRMMIGYVIVLVVVGAVVALGPRIPPVMVGVVLLATAALFPPKVSVYYLIFALPVAALVVRDPDAPFGIGIFERLAVEDGRRRRAVGICVSLAAALSIAQIALGQPAAAPIISGPLGVEVGTRLIVMTTIGLAPILWLVACTVIIVSYARRPAPSAVGGKVPAQDS